MSSLDPFVRVVIVNHNGGDLTLHSIESVKSTDWPLDRLEIVVVDNASSDGSAEAIEREHPDVRLLRASRNLGYAEATNLSLTDLGDVDFVALLNNDAEVGRSWLRPLVSALEADPELGAAAPKILFQPTFYELDLQTSASFPRLGDRRRLGIRLSGIRAGGEDYWTQVQFADGWHYPEYDHHVSRPFRWSEPDARLFIPESKEGTVSVELLVAADREKTVALASGKARQEVQIGPAARWIEVGLRGERRDLINSAGSRLVRGGYGADRGMLETDHGQYEQPAEVFAWSGCSVLLRPSYLADVGLLEPRFFLYYEDLDLSWRASSRLALPLCPHLNRAAPPHFFDHRRVGALRSLRRAKPVARPRAQRAGGIRRSRLRSLHFGARPAGSSRCGQTTSAGAATASRVRH